MYMGIDLVYLHDPRNSVHMHTNARQIISQSHPMPHQWHLPPLVIHQDH